MAPEPGSTAAAGSPSEARCAGVPFERFWAMLNGGWNTSGAGYGVEPGLLLDTVAARGLDAVAQVDLGHRTHGHQDTAALGRMAAEILHTVLARVDPARTRWATLTQFHRDHGVIAPHDHTVAWPERPPMSTIPDYAARTPRLCG